MLQVRKLNRSSWCSWGAYPEQIFSFFENLIFKGVFFLYKVFGKKKNSPILMKLTLKIRQKICESEYVN